MNIKTAILIVAALITGYASALSAQPAPQFTASLIPPASLTDNANLAAAPTVVVTTDGQPAATPPDPAPPQTGATQSSTGNDDQWHFSVSPYLWLPWVHGTVGAFGRDASFSVTPDDLLSHARFAVLGAVEARRNRIVTTGDILYMRLGANNAIPFPPALQAITANFTANIFILTPKVGYRLINQDRFKADFLTGIRYWYFSQNVNFTPSRLGLNFSKSQSWVDPLVGGRIEGVLTPKVVATVAGDVGGWGTGSQIEYQVLGILGYKLKPNMTLQAGYRYLYFDRNKYGAANGNANLALSGILLGLTYNFK